MLVFMMILLHVGVSNSLPELYIQYRDWILANVQPDIDYFYYCYLKTLNQWFYIIIVTITTIIILLFGRVIPNTMDYIGYVGKRGCYAHLTDKETEAQIS